MNIDAIEGFLRKIEKEFKDAEYPNVDLLVSTTRAVIISTESSHPLDIEGKGNVTKLEDILSDVSQEVLVIAIVLSQKFNEEQKGAEAALFLTRVIEGLAAKCHQINSSFKEPMPESDLSKESTDKIFGQETYQAKSNEDFSKELTNFIVGQQVHQLRMKLIQGIKDFYDRLEDPKEDMIALALIKLIRNPQEPIAADVPPMGDSEHHNDTE